MKCLELRMLYSSYDSARRVGHDVPKFAVEMFVPGTIGMKKLTCPAISTISTA